MVAPLYLALYRPHSDIWFRNNLGRILRRDLLPNKYAPLLDYLRQADAVELIFVPRLDGSALARFADALKLWLWCRVTGLGGTRLALTAASVSRAQVLFLMHYGNLTYETEPVASRGAAVARALTSLPLRKVVHLTHYVYCVETGAKNLAALKPDLLVAESNLADHADYFRAHFAQVNAPFVGLPYTAAARFQSRRAMSERTNKMVVTGSITYKMQDLAFRQFFGTQELQPMRRQLFDVASRYKAEMDCLVSDLDSSRVIARPNRLRRAWNTFRRITGVRTQHDYFRRDVVEIYNSYAMFAVPEEVCGLPAIGFVEGMACGSAYVGVEGGMYRDLGMLPGVHYIAYDGSVEDLMAQVRYHQQHPERTEAIAKAGCVLAHTVLGADAVYGDFVLTLRQLAGTSEVPA
ncbi:MAG: hypothetical protein NTZ96_13220 [Burkholderiales bacterium]|nr:hypothetical protein [Burkholderiales bacterium]